MYHQLDLMFEEFEEIPVLFIIRSVHQEDLVVNLKQALTRDSIPEITQTILNLAEFMEHCEEATVSFIVIVCFALMQDRNRCWS